MTMIFDGTAGITLPSGAVSNTTSTVVGISDTQTLTNKSLVASQLTGTQTIPKSTLPTGSVLQVVNATYTTETSTTSSSYVDTGWTFSITPTFSTSKIFIVARVTSRVIGYAFGSLQFVRGASTVLSPAPATAYETGITTGSADLRHVNSYVYLDSPATTSLVTYKVQMIAFSGYQYIVYPSNNPASVVMMEIAA